MIFFSVSFGSLPVPGVDFSNVFIPVSSFKIPGKESKKFSCLQTKT